MSITALGEARTYYERLLDAEFRGRKDTDGAARFRLSRRLGIPENRLFRLQYRFEEMRDVAGETYRRLREAYEALCQANEEAAERYRSERLELGQTENAAGEGPHSTVHRMGEALERTQAKGQVK